MHLQSLLRRLACNHRPNRMLIHSHQIGACFYIAWGLVRIASGLMLLGVLSIYDGVTALNLMGSALGTGMQATESHLLIDALVGMEAWYGIGLGAVVILVAALMNWRNSNAGYWVNMGVAGTADLVMLFHLVLPVKIYLHEYRRSLFLHQTR